MTFRVLDTRIKKLERSAQLTALSDLTDQELNAGILECLGIVAAPYNGDVRALIADMRASTDPFENDLATQVEDLMNNWDEFGMPPLH